jgi:hypothetical protein
VAVYELTRSDVGPQVGVVVTSALTAELRKLERVSVIGMDEVKTMLDLEAQKQLAGCSAESCLSEIAEALGADVVVTGSLARVGNNTFFALKKIEQSSASVAGQFTRKLTAADGEEFLAMVGPAVAELFADRPLRQGQKRGAPGALAARLNPPPLDPWMFWSAFGITSIVGVGAGASLTMMYDRYSVFSALRSEKSVEGPRLLAAQAEVQAWQTNTVALGSAAAVLALATTASGFFTDWNGYRAQIARGE